MGEEIKDVEEKVEEAVEEAVEAVEEKAEEAVEAVEAKVDELKEGVEQAAAEPAAKKTKKWVILGVVVAVIAVVGIGFWNWHNMPSFCNAFCHTSMDAYVETYDQQIGAAGVDKYGNEVSNTNAMLVVSHQKDNIGAACLDCHEPVITQQIGEVMETVTGNYTVYERANGNGYALAEVGAVELQENSSHDASNMGDAFCMKSGCHEQTREQLSDMLGAVYTDFNPHGCPHTDYACTDCHKSHRASTLVCTQCHADAASIMPDGWVDYNTGQALNPSA